MNTYTAAQQARTIANDAALALLDHTVAATVAVREDAHDWALDLMEAPSRRRDMYAGIIAAARRAHYFQHSA